MAMSKTGPQTKVYKFQLVEFVVRGRKKLRDIDVIPLRWIDAKNEKTVVSKFMPPPYDPESIELLHSLVKADAEAPESWPVYPVKIKGQSNSYDEAMKKLKKLQTEQFVFTSDKEFNQAEKASEVEKSIIKTKKYIVSEETRNAMSVPTMERDSKDDSPDPMNKSSPEDTSDSSNVQTGKELRQGPKFRTKLSCHVSSQQNNTSARSNNAKPLKKQQIQKMPPMVQTEARNGTNLEHEIRTSDIRTTQQNKNREFALILATLKGLAVDVKEISSTQNEILLQLNPTGNRVVDKKFAEKHHLSLPFRSQAKFIKFNDKLRTDDEFRTEFISSLDSLLDRELMLSKSLTNICKKYLSRDVALTYTVLRRMPGKLLLKDTMFYDCVLGVAIQTHKDPLRAKNVTEQMVDSAFGKVMNNAKDWDGQRRKRAADQSRKAATVNNVRRDDEEAVRKGMSNQESSHDEESDQEKGSDEDETT